MFNRFAAALLTGLLFVAGAGLGARAQQPAVDADVLGTQGLSDDEANGIKTMIEAWTKDLLADNLAAWDKYWADDAVLAPPGEDRLVGKADITAFAKKNFGSGSGFSFDNWSIAGRDDLTVITNTVTWQPTGGDSQTYNQMIVLRRESGGDWRVQSVLYTKTR